MKKNKTERFKIPYPKMYKSDIFGKYSLRIVCLAIFFTILYIVLSPFLSKYDYFWKEHSSAFLAFIFSVLFGIVTVGSYVVARRVERLIRDEFSDYSEFLRRGAKLIGDPPGDEVLVMMTFPAFELTENVRKLKHTNYERREIYLNNLFNDLIIFEKRKLKIVLLQENVNNQREFIKKMKDPFPEIKEKERLKSQLVYINRILELCDEHSHTAKDSSVRFPFHMFISGDHAVYTAVPDWKDYAKTKRLPCKGYETQDATIVNSLKDVFDLLKGNSTSSSKRPTDDATLNGWLS